MKPLHLAPLVACYILTVAPPCFICEEHEPFISLDRVGIGAYPRLVENDLEIFDLRDPINTTYNYTVEFVDECQGCNIGTYVIYALYDDLVSGEGEEVPFNEYGYDALYENNTGYLALDVSIKLGELLDSLNLSPDDELTPGSHMRFRTVLHLRDGQTFTSANSTVAVNGSAFNSYFDYSVMVTCPLQDDMFTGEYKIEYVEFEAGPHGPIFGMTPPRVRIRSVTGSTTLREFDWIYLPDAIYVEPITWRFDFACTEMRLHTMDTGSGCGHGSITIDQDGVLPVDITDDSEMVWKLIEFSNDGGCGVDPNPLTIRFTKI